MGKLRLTKRLNMVPSQGHKNANSDLLNPKLSNHSVLLHFPCPPQQTGRDVWSVMMGDCELLKDRNHVLIIPISLLYQSRDTLQVFRSTVFSEMKTPLPLGAKYRIKLSETQGHWPDAPSISHDLYWASLLNHTKLSVFSSCLAPEFC